MAYPIFPCSRYSYSSGLAKAASPRNSNRSPFFWYPFTTGSRSSCQPSALCTFPGRSVAPSQSPNWLNRKRDASRHTRSGRCRRLLPADHALDSPNCPCPESLAGVECEPWPAPPTGDSSGPAPLGCPLESESPSQNGSWCWFWRRCGLSLASPRQLSWLGLGKDVLHRWYHRSRPSGCRWTGGAEGPGGGGCCGRYGFPGDSRRLWG